MLRICKYAVSLSRITASAVAIAQQDALRPHSMYEPPAADAVASLVASSANVPGERHSGAKQVSYWVPMHQKRARLIIALLHPAAPYALIRWGFAASIFQTMGRIVTRPYLTAPIANKVAQEHPELMQQFQERLKTDASFSADPQARLDWWISRSNYQPLKSIAILFSRSGRRIGNQAPLI